MTYTVIVELLETDSDGKGKLAAFNVVYDGEDGPLAYRIFREAELAKAFTTDKRGG